MAGSFHGSGFRRTPGPELDGRTLSAVPVLSGLVLLALFAWELVLLITVATSSTKQGLHDRFAETAIVEPGGGSGSGVVLGCLVLIAAFIAMMLLSFVAHLFLGGQVSGILSTIGESVWSGRPRR